MDPRTGLGRFREFRISNYQLMMQLIDDCTQLTVGEILQTPDVAERVELYEAHNERATEQICRCAEVHDNLVVLDLREEEIIHPTNRFMVYALFPKSNISIHVLWGLKQQNTVFATGKSIINRSSKTDVGEPHARVRRRRPQRRRHLPDPQPGRRARPGRAGGADHFRRLARLVARPRSARRSRRAAIAVESITRWKRPGSRRSTP